MDNEGKRSDEEVNKIIKFAAHIIRTKILQT